MIVAAEALEENEVSMSSISKYMHSKTHSAPMPNIPAVRYFNFRRI